jgi:hypothetical protein
MTDQQRQAVLSRGTDTLKAVIAEHEVPA